MRANAPQLPGGGGGWAQLELTGALGEHNIKRAIALIWISSFLFRFPSFFLQEWSETHSTCIGPWSFHMNQASKIYVIINSVLTTFIPVMVILYCYGSLIKGLYFTNTVCAMNTQQDRSSDKKKLVVTFILATTGFVIGYGPVVVFYSILASAGGKQISFKLYSDISRVFLFVFYCSLSFNPILYAFRSTNFQEGFKRIIFCHKPTPPNEIQLEWYNLHSYLSFRR